MGCSTYRWSCWAIRSRWSGRSGGLSVCETSAMKRYHLLATVGIPTGWPCRGIEIEGPELPGSKASAPANSPGKRTPHTVQFLAESSALVGRTQVHCPDAWPFSQSRTYAANSAGKLTLEMQTFAYGVRFCLRLQFLLRTTFLRFCFRFTPALTNFLRSYLAEVSFDIYIYFFYIFFLAFVTEKVGFPIS